MIIYEHNRYLALAGKLLAFTSGLKCIVHLTNAAKNNTILLFDVFIIRTLIVTFKADWEVEDAPYMIV
jgi:hypothetical protein